MQIHFNELVEGQNHLIFQETQNSLSLRPEDIFLMNPVDIDLFVFRSEQKFTFQGKISALVEAECARCLRLFSFPAQAEIKFILDQTEVPDSAETQDDDYQFISKALPTYDLSPRLREALILSMPMRFLCSPDCRGLCPQCGTNLNQQSCNCNIDQFDPRWGRLEQLIKE